MSTASASDSSVRDYRLSALLRARLMGLALALIGAVLLVVTILVFAAGLSGNVLTAVVILVVIAVFGLGIALTRRWYVVRLDPHGYRVRLIRGAGAKQSRWSDVLDLSTSTVAGARCAVLRLRDGRTTTIPVDLVQGDPEEFVRELGRHLGAANGRPSTGGR